MGEVTRSQQGNSLDFSPAGQGIQDHLSGCRSGKFGVDMEVSHKFHGELGIIIRDIKGLFKENHTRDEIIYIKQGLLFSLEEGSYLKLRNAES